MKKTYLQKFQELIREDISYFYECAWTVKGNRPEAERLVESAVMYGARRFPRLKNKALVSDLILLKIGKGTFAEIEKTDCPALYERVMAKVRSAEKTKALIASVCTLALVLLVGFGVYAALNPEKSPPPPEVPQEGFVIMDNTKNLVGDLGVAELVNYHSISTVLNKKAKPITFQDRMDYVGRMAAAVTAPSGTQYVAYHNLETEDGANTTFTLYRAAKEGWEEIGTREVSCVLWKYTFPWTQEDFYQAWIALVTDADSNAYAITTLNGELVVYRYDCKENTFEIKNARAPYQLDHQQQYMNARYDAGYGEQGAIYVSVVHCGVIRVYRYDIAADVFTPFAEEIDTKDTATQVVFDVKDDVVYLVSDQGFSPKKFVYYRISETEILSSQTIYTSGSNPLENGGEDIKNRNVGSGGIAVDENGNVHVLSTKSPSIWGEPIYTIQYYRITPDGEVTKTSVDRLYFANAYEPTCACVFEGKDGEIYFMETYSLMENFISIGKLNPETGTFEYYDGFDLPDNLSLDRVRVMNNTFLFYTSQDTVCYFYFMEEKRSD